MTRRRRKDVASLLRTIERPHTINTAMGVASSIGKDGKIINGQEVSDGENRDLWVALPYGISSSGLDGIRVQMITNDNQNNVVVGVIDKNKPQVRSGCLILYDKSGSQIRLNGDGTIGIKCDKITINDKIIIDNKSNKVQLNVGEIVLNGNIKLANDVSIDGNIRLTGSATLNGQGIMTY